MSGNPRRFKAFNSVSVSITKPFFEHVLLSFVGLKRHYQIRIFEVIFTILPQNWANISIYLANIIIARGISFNKCICIRKCKHSSFTLYFRNVFPANVADELFRKHALTKLQCARTFKYCQVNVRDFFNYFFNKPTLQFI